MQSAYYIGFKKKITNEFFLEQLQIKLATIFGGLKFWGLRKPNNHDMDENIWQQVIPSISKTTDTVWRIGTDGPSPIDQYKMRTGVHVFDVRVMKTGFKYHFSSPGDYWRTYALRRVIDSMAIDLEAEIVELGINLAYTKKVEPHLYKGYLDFLKQACPKKIKTARTFYLEEIKKLPQEILDAESGLKNFL